jgi:hypothetical protein
MRLQDMLHALLASPTAHVAYLDKQYGRYRSQRCLAVHKPEASSVARPAEYPCIELLTDQVPVTAPEPRVAFALRWPNGTSQILARFETATSVWAYTEQLAVDLKSAGAEAFSYFERHHRLKEETP